MVSNFINKLEDSIEERDINPCKDCITFAICRSCIHPWLNTGNIVLLARYCQLIKSKYPQITRYIQMHHETEKHEKTKQYMSDESFIIQRMKIKCDIIRETFA